MKEWKEKLADKYALLIEGARRVGKTHLVQEFVQKEYESSIFIDFSRKGRLVKESKKAFTEENDIEGTLERLQTLHRVSLIPGRSCVVFDEVQRFPIAREAIKQLMEYGKYHYIETGSLLGIHENVKDIVIPSEEHKMKMFPLDFEEFLWANGINPEVIEALEKFYLKESPVPAGIHVAMKRYLNLYVAIGGLPAPINAFLATNNMNDVSNEYKGILKEYRDDMVKYAPDKDKPHIRECFNSIPKQLAKDNKKFQYTKVKPGGRGETFAGSLQWLEDAGIICRCYNTDITGLPMEGNAKDNVFKVYTADIGLLIEMLGSGTRADILQGNLGGFKGAIYENLMADTLHKKQQNLYYFQKDSGLELEFLVRMKGECVPIEVKAKSAKAKSAQTVLKHPQKYSVKHIIKFGDYNVGRDGGLLTLPSYMQFLLNLEPEALVLEPVDVDAVNAMAKEILNK